MAAYWQGISNLTNARVTAAIYSTATGQLVIYEPNGNDWLQRLVKLLSPRTDRQIGIVKQRLSCT
jgi:hypothetical protein